MHGQKNIKIRITISEGQSTRTFMIPRSFLLRTRYSSDKYVKKMKIHICSITLFFSENRGVYKILWKIYCTAGQATDNSIIRRMRLRC